MKKDTIRFRMSAAVFAAGLLVFHMVLPGAEVFATGSELTAGELTGDTAGQTTGSATTQTGQTASDSQTAAGTQAGVEDSQTAVDSQTTTAVQTGTESQTTTAVQTGAESQTGAGTQTSAAAGAQTTANAQTPDADASDDSDENRVNESTSMPEWTDRLVTGRGETEEGFSGSGLDVRKVDADYEGELDAVTGLPVTSGAEQRQTTGRVQLSDTMYYDFDQRGFFFLSPRFGVEIGANVADGMVTKENVAIVVPDGVATTLYKDGNVVEKPALTAIREPGGYVLRIGNGSENEDLLSFTITSTTTGSLNYYSMPESFYVTSVTRDGQDVSGPTSRVELLTEGEYSIEYGCPKAALSYTLSLTVDHTPPELTFTGVDERGRARGPVTYAGLEKGDTVTCLKDGSEYTPRRATLSQMGKYVLTVTDKAGNSNTYYVTILLYLNAQSVVFFALFIAIVAALVAYLQISRRRMRVR